MGITDAQQGKRFFSVEEAYAEGDPYSHYAWFREHDPVHLGQPGWPLGYPQIWLFRHADVMRWLRDPRVVKLVGDIPEIRALREVEPYEAPAQDTFGFVANRMMLFQDPPDHTRLRGLANRAFTPRVVADRRREIEALTRDLVRTLRDQGEGDLNRGAVISAAGAGDRLNPWRAGRGHAPLPRLGLGAGRGDRPADGGVGDIHRQSR
jgi:cytochrome P450